MMAKLSPCFPALFFFLFFSFLPISELGSITLHRSVKYPQKLSWRYVILDMPWFARAVTHTPRVCPCVLISSSHKDTYQLDESPSIQPHLSLITSLALSPGRHILRYLQLGFQDINLVGGVYNLVHNMTKLLFCQIIYFPSLQYPSLWNGCHYTLLPLYLLVLGLANEI